MKSTLKHRMDVLSDRIEDLTEQIEKKEILMASRGNGNLILGADNYRAIFGVHFQTYGTRSLRNLYQRRRSLESKLHKLQQECLNKELQYQSQN